MEKNGYLTSVQSQPWQARFLLSIAGLGGLLYGIDIGIIAAALLYLGKSISLSVEQTSILVAAVLGGSMVSSVFAGFLADFVGRKRMMIFSAMLFVGSVAFIVLSRGFAMLLFGRILQGVSGGVIAVIVPLYLAETLPANTRGRGSAVFQFMLTFGILAAAAVGFLYSRHAEAMIFLAGTDSVRIHAAEDHAWRGMFMAVAYPGILFLLGSFFIPESPRWLFSKGRMESAHKVLQITLTESEAKREMLEMQHLREQNSKSRLIESHLLQRRFVLPFLLACFVLTFNQMTGINSLLEYLVVILREAGMTAVHATQGDVCIKLLSCLVTLIAIYFVDRRGRKFLLTIGTMGIVIALSVAGCSFYSFESKSIDITREVSRAVQRRDPVEINANTPIDSKLILLYNVGHGTEIIHEDVPQSGPFSLPADILKMQMSLQVERAYIIPKPSRNVSWLVMIALALFIASYSIGPGVVVWLALSELMPTRIRSAGMGVALLLNQGVSTGIAGLFLPVVVKHGYHTMFFFWAACSAIYFIVTVFFLPETKGKTLEEIELEFAR